MLERERDRRSPLRERIHEIIFEADTPAGKFFDVALLGLILVSVLVVILESVSALNAKYLAVFRALEWFFTLAFTVEYLLRLYSVYRPWKYAISFFGIVDLLAIFPTYLSLFLTGTQYFIVIRALRLLRVFRIFKLGHFLDEGAIIMSALRASRAKITVFLTFVLLMVTIIGSLMYLIEGGLENTDFENIPKGIYWAIVTLTTVGYGDITPKSGIGQFLSGIVMILGYAVIAVPTGIVSAEFIARNKQKVSNTRSCRYCGREGHADDAVYCKYCGERLD